MTRVWCRQVLSVFDTVYLLKMPSEWWSWLSWISFDADVFLFDGVCAGTVTNRLLLIALLPFGAIALVSAGICVGIGASLLVARVASERHSVARRPQLNKDTRICISLAKRPSNIGTRFHNFLYEELGLDFLYKAWGPL